MNLLVAGGAGYIGSVFVEEACNAGHNVTVFDSLVEGHREAIDERAKFVPGDLGDHAAILAALRKSEAEAVLHFAGFIMVGESMQDPTKYFRNNVSNSIELLDACVQAGVKKMVFSSTAAIFGMPDRVPIEEDFPKLPVNAYGESKLMFESLLRWYQQIHGLDFVAFRYFNAAGASPTRGEAHRVETHLIPNILKVPLGQKESCSIFGTDYDTSDGTCIRDYIHIQDLASAHLLALKPEVNGHYNLGNGEGYSVRQVIDTCQQVTGQDIKVIKEARRPGDPPRLIASSQKAIDELGWQPTHTKLEDIVASAWNWHQNNPQGYGK
ncbi:MAG: UDP-glucose 4-epimerase GalE [Limisphaerales bacterium]